jgi:tetratricopeptide (TPR) repeat protein
MPLRSIVAVVVIGALAIAAIDYAAYQPWRCSVMRRSLEPATLRLWEQHRPIVLATVRHNAELARGCIRITPYDPGPYMLAAANDRMAGDYLSAMTMYERALRFDRRPELYFDLGLMQLELGKVADAEESFVQAAFFDPYTILEIPPEDVRNRVMDRVGKDHYLEWLGLDQPAAKKAMRR